MKNVVVEGVSHTFKMPAEDVIALDKVSLQVGSHELTVLLGVSGSGKTTLINVLAGLVRPARGEIESFGVNLMRATPRDLAGYRRETASLIFQEYNLLSMLSAHENVAFQAELAGYSRKDAEDRATDALSRMGLGAESSRYPGELSGGQRQRVAIARAIVSPKPLLLADEPTGSLDRTTANAVVSNLADIRDRGACVIVATHDTRIAERADRVVTLVDGHIESNEGTRR